MTPPDTGTRIAVATIALVLILAWALGGHALWTGQPLLVSR